MVHTFPNDPDGLATRRKREKYTARFRKVNLSQPQSTPIQSEGPVRYRVYGPRIGGSRVPYVE